MIKEGFWWLMKIVTVSVIIELGGYDRSAWADTYPVCVSQLETEVDQVIERPEWSRSRWGILVRTLDGSETIYNLEGDKYFLPASNLKLLTTAAALEELGSEFAIATPVYLVGEAPRLESLTIVGSGDPSLTSDRLRQLARELKRQGIDSIEELIVTDDYLKDSGINLTWEISDLYFYYAAGVNSLILDENSVTLTVIPQDLRGKPQLQWSDPNVFKQWRINNQVLAVANQEDTNINLNGLWGNSELIIEGEIPNDSQPLVYELAIPNPSNYFLDSFYRILLVEQIQVGKKTLTDIPPENLTTAFTQLLSPPLEQLILKINHESNNLYAEAIAKILVQESGKTTEEILAALGVDPSNYRLADASGLSRHNLVAPEALVQTLTLIAQSPQGQVYRDSLPQPGEGTLKHRLPNLDLQAKTGYLTGVASLSGYLQPRDYEPLVFSIIINQSDQSGKSLQGAIDEIVLLLSHLHRC